MMRWTQLRAVIDGGAVAEESAVADGVGDSVADGSRIVVVEQPCWLGTVDGIAAWMLIRRSGVVVVVVVGRAFRRGFPFP